MYTFTEKLPQDKIQSGNEIIEEYLHNQFKEYDRRDDIDIHTDYDKIFDIEYCLDNLVGVKGKYKKSKYNVCTSLYALRNHLMV